MKFVSPPKQWWKTRNRLPETKKEIIDQRAIFQTRLQVPQPKAASDISNFPKNMKTVTLITVQTCSRGKTKTEFTDSSNLGKIKIKRRVQNFKNLGKQLQLQHSPNPNWSRSAINDWISTKRDQTHVIARQPSSASAPWLQWTLMGLTEAELIIRSWWRCPYWIQIIKKY